MKNLIATVVLLALGTTAQAGATQAPASSASRYWLSDDLNRLVFWQVRAPARPTPASVEAPVVEGRSVAASSH